MSLGWGAYGLGGHMRHRLLPALQQAKNGRLVAVGHYKMDTAKEAAKEFRTNRAYDSLEALLKDDEVQAVVVATPNYLHYEHAKAVIEAKKHVLLEKPMTLEVKHAVELTGLAAKNGVKLGIGFHLRHHPVLEEMGRRIAAGEIGESLYLQASFGRTHLWPPGIWWSDTERSGPQVLMGYGVHALDMCRWMLNADFARVYASMLWEPANTFIAVHLDMSTRARCSLMCSTELKYIPNTVEVMGRKGRLVGAGAVTTTDAGTLLRSTGGNVELIKVAQRDPYTVEFERFNEAVLEGKPFHAEGIDGLRVVRAQVAITESSETGRTVAIPGED